MTAPLDRLQQIVDAFAAKPWDEDAPLTVAAVGKELIAVARAAQEWRLLRSVHGSIGTETLKSLFAVEQALAALDKAIERETK